MDERETRARILVVNDVHGVGRVLQAALKDDVDLLVAKNGIEAVDMALHHSLDVAVLDVLLPDMDGITLLQKLKQADPRIEVVMATAVTEISTAVRAIKSGACEYLVKPFAVDALRNLIHRIIRARQRARSGGARPESSNNGSHPFENMVGRNHEMREIFRFITTVARSDGAVLIQGESGTGKELVARAIHNRSSRWNQPFAVVNCAAVPQTLMERELFGHIRGAFTSASATLPGKLEQADKGTVFLDDIDTLDTSMQAKLLRVIQHKEFERLGSSRSMRVDVRFVAACNKDLRLLMSRDLFREDLYFRLNVFPIVLPPLRHRREDIPLLVDHFLRLHGDGGKRASKRMSRNALKVLMDHDWPGNIRELENLVQRVCTLTRKHFIRTQDLPLDRVPKGKHGAGSLREAILEFERTYIRDVLQSVNGNRQEAARRLGIHRNTLHGKMALLGL